jgi:tetratricopeptide (TPR) repeat protein
MFIQPKDFDKAQEMFAEAAKIGPQYAFNHINLGDAYRAQGNFESAAGAYSKAIELDSENFIAYSKRGHVNSFLGNYEEARADYQASRQYNEYGNQGYTFEAFTYLHAGEVDKSLEWLEAQAQGLDESGLDESRIKSGKFSCANACMWIAFHHGKQEHLERLVKMRNELNMELTNQIGTERAVMNTQANNVLWDGMVAAVSGDYETAMAKAEENKQLLEGSTNPNKLFQYHFLVGYVNYKQENYEAAEASFRNGNPNWIYNDYLLAKSLKSLGKEEEAMELMKKVANWNFNSVHYALVRNELMSNEAEEVAS